MKKSLNIRPDQLFVYEVLNRNWMAWAALSTVLALFVGVTVCLVVALFTLEKDAPKFLLTALDGSLFWALRHMVKFLFPNGKAATTGPSKDTSLPPGPLNRELPAEKHADGKADHSTV